MQLDGWLERFGYSTRQLPEIAGRYEGKSLIICGDAACVWDDLERAGCRGNPTDISRGSVQHPSAHFMVINKLGETFPGNIEHWYSNEAGLLGKFAAARRNEYSKEFHGPVHTHSMQKGAKWHWPLGGHGTSALGATLVGVGLGYDRILLCGVPLDDGPHNGEPPWRTCRFRSSEAASPKNTDDINHYWKIARDLAFDGKVRSMSGRTQKWLG